MKRRAIGLVAMLAVAVTTWPLLSSTDRGVAATVVAGRVHGSFQPADGKIYILVLGSDARFGNPVRSRADAIHILGINTRTMRGGILNFPRDSWVDIPGWGSGKINEALYAGGPRLVAQTVEQVTGIRLDYWVLTAFEGFTGIVQALGGVPITLHQDIYDIGGSGAQLEAGRRHLTWWQSLAFVRTRKAFKHGDIVRTTNQARFLLGMLRLLRAQAEREPATILKWIAVGRKHARLDIPPDELFELAVLATQVSPSSVGNVTVPVSVGSVGAASVVFISPNAQSLFRRFEKNASL